MSRTSLFFLLFSVMSRLSFGQNIQHLQVSLMDTAQIRIIRAYIAHNELANEMKKESNVLNIKYLYDSVHPDSPQWSIGATGRQDYIIDNPPALLSGLDGYRIAIYFAYMTERFITFSSDHVGAVNKYLLPGLAEKPAFQTETFDIHKPGGVINRRTIERDPRPSEKFVSWLATFPIKGYATWKILERGALIDNPKVIKSVIINPQR